MPHLFRYIMFLLTLFTMGSSCKPSQKGSDIKGGPAENPFVELAFSNVVHKDLETFYNSLLGKGPISESVLKLIPRLIDDAEVVGPIRHSTTSGFKDMTLEGKIDPVSNTLINLMACRIGTRVFIFSTERSESASQSLPYRIFGALPTTYLPKKSLEEKAKTYAEARGIDKDRLKAVVSSLNTLEVLIHLFPGVTSAARIKGATSLGQVLLGSVYFAGDLATFGLGSKVNFVRKGAAAVVATAGSVKLSQAASDLHNGKANYTTGVDAFMGVTSIGLATISIVKIQLPVGKNGFVKSIDEANVLAKELKRAPDDIFKNGITKEELAVLGIEVTSDAGKVLARAGAKRSAAEIAEFAKALALPPSEARKSPIIADLLSSLSKLRGKEFKDAEVPIVLYYELLIQRFMRSTGKSYDEAFNEIASFNLLYAGNTTLKANRMLQNGIEKPDAFHRIIGSIHSKIANTNFSSKSELVDALKGLGYSSAETYPQLDQLLFYFQKILPNASPQKSVLYSVKDLSAAAEKTLESIANDYVSRGVLSTATTIEDAVSFLQAGAKKAVIFRFLPSAKQAIPIVGDGELTVAAKALQASRGYSGFASNEVVLVTGGKPNIQIVHKTTQTFSVHGESVSIQVVDIQL
ncbi:MAG: hypothetical protein NTV34_07770 [Proteobacteria bacterium]|nr:hypothetical protein [Pseudomonadota bacterium]